MQIAARQLFRINIINKNYSVGLEIFLIVIIPVFILQAGLVPIALRIHTFALCLLIVPISIWLNNISFQDIGIRLDTLKIALPVFIAQALILALLAGIAMQVMNIQTGTRLQSDILTPEQYVLISIPVQQLVFFGFLRFRLLSVINDNRVLLPVFALLFCMVHIPWNNINLTLITFTLGLWWGFLNLRYPNLIASTLSHMIVGSTFVLITYF